MKNIQLLSITSILCFFCYSPYLWSGGKGYYFKHQHQSTGKHIKKKPTRTPKREKRSLEDIPDKQLRYKTRQWISTITNMTSRSVMCSKGLKLGKGVRGDPSRKITMKEVLGKIPPNPTTRYLVNRDVRGVDQDDTLHSTCIEHYSWKRGDKLNGYKDGPVLAIVNKWYFEDKDKATTPQVQSTTDAPPTIFKTDAPPTIFKTDAPPTIVKILSVTEPTQQMNRSNLTHPYSAASTTGPAQSILLLTVLFSILK